ncbi:MAG: diacylglycerol kinase family protein [bacterium]
MYYYIFDIKKCKKKSQVEDIKSYIATLGISGEFTYPSAAQTAEELVDLGLSKKYNTIVAIGGDELVNTIAGKLCGRPEALGVIPLDVSDDLATIIGASNWKDGCENLRFRKINEMKIGKTATNNHFITSLELDIKQPTEVTIEFRDYIVQSIVNKLTISNFSPHIHKIDPDFLDIELFSTKSEKSFSLSSLFGRKKIPDGYSIFRARSLRVFTKSQIPLVTDDYALAKTPQLVEITDELLRIITQKI